MAARRIRALIQVTRALMAAFRMEHATPPSDHPDSGTMIERASDAGYPGGVSPTRPMRVQGTVLYSYGNCRALHRPRPHGATASYDLCN